MSRTGAPHPLVDPHFRRALAFVRPYVGQLAPVVVLSLVGTALGTSSPAMARAITALGDCRIHMLSLSSTGINLTLIVDEDSVGEAMRRLHAAFFEAAA